MLLNEPLASFLTFMERVSNNFIQKWQWTCNSL